MIKKPIKIIIIAFIVALMFYCLAPSYKIRSSIRSSFGNKEHHAYLKVISKPLANHQKIADDIEKAFIELYGQNQTIEIRFFHAWDRELTTPFKEIVVEIE